MRLWYKISIPVFLLMAGMFLVIFLLSQSLKTAFLEEEVFKLKEAVDKHQNIHLQKEYFLNSSRPQAQEQFKTFFEVLQNSTIARFTIWDTSHKIIFSDLASIVGQRSPNHADLKKLFKSNAAFFIAKTKDNNFPKQSNIGEFLDIYIPIKVNEEILGAVEIHAVQKAILAPFERQAQNIIFIMIAGSLISVLIIFVLEYRFIIRPLYALRRATKSIIKGDFEHQITVHSKDEIGDLASDFELMRFHIRSDYFKQKEFDKILILEKEKVESEVKTRTQELQEEKARLLSSINSLSFGFLIADKKGNIILKNPAALSILGINNKLDLIADTAKLFSKDFDIVEVCDRCLSEKTIIRVKDISYGSKYLNISCIPIFFSKESKEVSEYVVLVEDETEAKVLERSRDEFFAVASHELRTPLTAIRGNAEMIQQFYGNVIKDQELRNMLKDIQEGSIRLIDIVNDFLDVSRIEQGKVIIKKEQFELAKLIEKVSKDLKNSADAKNIILKLNFTGNKFPKVFADIMRVEQILVNIIGNAIKFTQQGGITISIAAEPKGFLKVFVSDTGIGILPHNQTLLFRKFQQAGEKMLARDVTQGTGLGLYISRLLIENMGGTIGLLKSEAGKGSTFYFTIPIVL